MSRDQLSGDVPLNAKRNVFDHVLLPNQRRAYPLAANGIAPMDNHGTGSRDEFRVFRGQQNSVPSMLVGPTTEMGGGLLAGTGMGTYAVDHQQPHAPRNLADFFAQRAAAASSVMSGMASGNHCTMHTHRVDPLPAVSNEYRLFQLQEYRDQQLQPQVNNHHVQWPTLPADLMNAALLSLMRPSDTRLNSALPSHHTLPPQSSGLMTTQSVAHAAQNLDPRTVAWLLSGADVRSSSTIQNSGSSQTPSSGRLLAQPSDGSVMSQHQTFLRLQIEVFQATEDDASAYIRGRNRPIQVGQVGIRCRHCAHLPKERRPVASRYFPAKLLGIYQAAQNMSTNHIQCGLCPEMPDSIKEEFKRLIPTKNVSSISGRSYWAESARSLGLVDTEEDGIFMNVVNGARR